MDSEKNSFQTVLLLQQKMKRNIYIVWGILAFFAVLLFFTRYPFLLIIPVIIAVIIPQSMRKNYVRMYKQILVQGEIEKVFVDGRLNLDAGLAKETVFASRLVSKGNIYTSNDIITGRYRDVDVQVADVLIQNRVQTGKSSTTVTYFKGRWMILSGVKKTADKVYVVGRDFRYFGGQDWGFNRPKLDKIETESIDFNKAFKVYAGDGHDAFYILTPVMMENLMAFPSDGSVALYNEDNVMTVALSTNRDAFEPKLFSPLDYNAEIAAIQEDLQRITRVIDELIEEK